MKWPLVVLVLAGAGAAAGWGLLRHSQAQTKPVAAAPKPAVPVEVAVAIAKAMPIQISAIGRVQTIASVAVKTRIDGVIASVNAVDGQEVKAGDVLFTLDDRALQSAVHQVESQVARDRAQMENAKREVERQAPLSQRDFVSRTQMDQTRTTAAAAEATLHADEAQLDLAKVQLSYTVIRAPIAGKLGTISFKLGSSIKANDTTSLVVLNQITPIYVAMSVPQSRFPTIRRAMARGNVPTVANVPGDKRAPPEGKLAYMENAIDTASNTLSVKAEFPNTDHRLWPGQFVNVAMTLEIQPDAIVIPAEAIQAGQNGSFVFVVKSDSTVEARPITVDRALGGEAVIEKGVDAGEQVVTSGQLRLDDGVQVKVRPRGDEPATKGTS